MKILLSIILFAAFLFAARAADPVVVVQNAGSVTIDGLPSGTVVDVLVNSKAANIRALLLDAWLAYEKQVVATFAATESARADKAIADAKAAYDKASADAQAAVAQAQADAKAATDSAAKEAANSAGIIAALRGLDPTFLPPVVKAQVLSSVEKDKAALAAQKADIEAKLAKLP